MFRTSSVLSAADTVHEIRAISPLLASIKFGNFSLPYSVFPYSAVFSCTAVGVFAVSGWRGVRGIVRDDEEIVFGFIFVIVSGVRGCRFCRVVVGG